MLEAVRVHSDIDRSPFASLSQPAFKPYRIDNTQVKKIIHELDKGQSILFGHHKTPGILQLAAAVSVYGTARSADNSEFFPYQEMYEMTRECGRQLAKHGFIVVTGGGPGAMEAANRGCMEGGTYSAGVGIRLPFEQTNNSFLDKSLVTGYFCTRKMLFAKASKAFISTPGGYGTLDEFFEMWNLEAKADRRINKPLVLLGREFWQPIDELLRHYSEKYNVISPRQLAMVSLTDCPEHACKIVKLMEYQNPELFESKRVYDKEMLKRVRGDLFGAMSALVDNAPYVSVIGGSSNGLTDNASLVEAKKLGAYLAQDRIATLTTGVNCLTQSFNEGVLAKGGIASGFVHRPYETKSNSFLSTEIVHSYRLTAEVMAMKYGAKAEIFFPGGLGMLDRLFEQATLIQTGITPDRRILCVGKDYFEPLVDHMQGHFYRKYRTISEDDHKIIEVVDSAEQAFEIARAEYIRTLDERLKKAA